MPYRFSVTRSDYYDFDQNHYRSNIQDVANSIPDIIPDVVEGAVTVEEICIFFQSFLKERNILDLMKSKFIDHDLKASLDRI